MFFHQRFIPGLAIASYMVADEKTKEAAIIDPTRDVDEFIDIAKREGFHIRHVLETHVHADFVSGSAQLKLLLPDVTAHCSAMGGPEWTPPYADHKVKDGDVVEIKSLVGEGKIRVKLTEGLHPSCVWLPSGYGIFSKYLTTAYDQGLSYNDFLPTMFDPAVGHAMSSEVIVQVKKA